MPNREGSLPTQQFIEIESVENDTIKLKGGGLRKIILVSGTNFSLKSTEEQEMITQAFQGFLNSLDFTVQFFIHSRKLNIDDYIKTLEEREIQEENSLLKNQILEYREFVKTVVRENAIMQKRFFVVVPYDPIAVPGAGLNIADALFSWGKSKKTAQEKKDEKFEESLQQLNARVSQIIDGLNQIGLRAVSLENDELIELFYNLYNPSTVAKKVDLETQVNK
ncbi:MAG: hypothetical protein HZB99_04340 [Candidatus Harrisonbacteria bacterium]|nr:hypothetical protein [Candidatus Harrisonbacteria bacterium]